MNKLNDFMDKIKIYNPELLLIPIKEKNAVFPLTQPTLNFCADPAVFIAKSFSYIPTLNFLREMDK